MQFTRPHITNAVRGPFIEYECSVCGCAVQESADTNRDRLMTRIVEANTYPKKRLCAACG
jgi:hypothetical protein